MRLRTRLILAFLLLAVLPLGGATLYSYNSSLQALQQAVQAESGQLAGEMERRVATVTTDLRRRIDRLSGLPNWAVGDGAAEPERIREALLAEMGDAARYFERIEIRPEAPSAPEPESPDLVAVPDDGTASGPVQVQLSVDLGGDATEAGMPLQFETDSNGSLVLRRGSRPAAGGAPDAPPASAPVPPATPAAPGGSEPTSDVLRAFEAISQQIEERHRLRQAGLPVPAAGDEEMRQKLESGLGGASSPERQGAVKAQISSREVLRQVMSRTRRDRGEIPFAVDQRGNLYTPDPADRPRLESLGLEESVQNGDIPEGGALVGDWVTVLRQDPNTGLYFGIARPLAASLAKLRTTAARNLGLGLGLVCMAILGILPLSRRMTRNLATLTAGAETLARGDLSARVAVRSRDEFGILSSAFNRMAEQLGESQRRLLEQERLRRELEIGRQMQRELLPHGALRVPRLEVRGSSIPALEVGGDFYNYFLLPGGEVAVAIGDVSGKGVGAALLMANIQASLRALCSPGVDLAELVGRLDRELEANTPAEAYCTLFLGLIDPTAGRLRYVNAGHNPPFAIEPTGHLHRLDPGGRPVGLLPGPGYRQDTLSLPGGSLLLLYTDGVVESESPAGEPFGMRRVQEMLRREGTSPLERLLSEMEREVHDYRAGGEPADDATLLAARLDPPSPGT